MSSNKEKTTNNNTKGKLKREDEDKRMTRNSTREYKAQQNLEEDIPFGAIGFTFEKFFPGHGYFVGMVVEIRPGAAYNKDRRCVYSDGDSEDLSLLELRSIVRAEKKRKQRQANKVSTTIIVNNNAIDNSIIITGNGNPNRTHSPVLQSNGVSLQGKKIKNENETSQMNTSSQIHTRNRRVEETSNNNNNNVVSQSNEVTLPGMNSSKNGNETSQMITSSQTHTSKRRVEKTESRTNSFKKIFDTAHELLPIDIVAESTLKEIDSEQTAREKQNKKRSRDDSDDESSAADIQWLTKVASLLGAGAGYGKTNERNKVRKRNENLGESSVQHRSHQGPIVDKVPQGDPSIPDTVSKVESNKSDGRIQKEDDGIVSSLSGTELLFSTLTDVKRGHRHGSKVFRLNDKQHVVGEVLVEHQYGWVEVVFGGEIFKDRVGNFVVAPDGYELGDRVEEFAQVEMKKTPIHDVVSTSKTVSAPSQKKNQPTSNGYTTNVESQLTLKSLFYWCCNVCTMMNIYLSTTCCGCNQPKNLRCTLSALFQMAKEAAMGAKSLEEAMEAIPTVQRNCIPESVMMKILSPNDLKSQHGLPPPDTKVNTYFYWVCGFCTIYNSYKRFNCETCSKRKGENSTLSVLFSIATEAASRCESVAEAMEAIPECHRPAIPESVVKSLITCTAVAKGKRRCLRPKVPGLDYCVYHKDTLQARCKTNNSSTSITKSEVDFDGNADSSILKLQKDYSSFLMNHAAPKQINIFDWKINCIEDSILCQEKSPFPLGLLVRRYFPRYDFHDGRIVHIHRKNVKYDGRESRPVLVYGVLYNDGDSEELLHHEVNSLRQLYDQRNVKPTAHAREQIVPGTIYATHFGKIIIIDVKYKTSNICMVQIKYFKEDEDDQEDMSIELTTLQLTILNKILKTEGYEGSNKDSNNIPSSILEWPCHKRSHENTRMGCNIYDSKHEAYNCASGLWIYEEKQKWDYNENDDDIEKESHSAGINPCYKRSLSTCSNLDVDLDYDGWDPGFGSNYVAWDPFKNLKCEQCKSGKDDRLILICDKCHVGYHTYCVRPVIVTIPKGSWLCPQCSPPQMSMMMSFPDEVDNLVKNLPDVYSFLSLNNDESFQFFIKYKDALHLLAPTTHYSNRLSLFGNNKSLQTVKVGDLYISRPKSDRHLFRLPEPPLNENDRNRSLSSMVAAMKFCGMTHYSEELVYRIEDGVNEDMNDGNIEQVQSLSKKNENIFREYKHNLKMGVYPPIEIVYNPDVGFTVVSLATIQRHTIITEYVGEVIKESSETSSDSLMTLLNTGNPETTLIIDPTRKGNIARFLSGINNKNHVSKLKANVRTLRFVFEGKCRVVLFTSKQISAGDELHYDYNAGNVGKSVQEWAKTGFYDTRNFL